MHKIRITKEDGKITADSGAHPFAVIMGFFTGTAVTMLIIGAGQVLGKSQFFDVGRPRSILGILPALIFFITIFGATLKNRITSDKNGLTLENSALFFFNSKKFIPKEEIDAVTVKKEGEKQFTFSVIRGEDRLRSMMWSKREKILELAKGIAEMLNVEYRIEEEEKPCGKTVGKPGAGQ